MFCLLYFYSADNFKKYKDYTVAVTEKKETNRGKRNAIVGSENRWPDAIVPYTIVNGFSSKLYEKK